MVFFPALFLFAASSVVDSVTYRDVIARSNWGYHDLSDISGLEEPADVRVEYSVQAGPPVSIELVRHEGIDRLAHGRLYKPQVATEYDTTGALHARVADPTDYAVVIDNRGNDSGAATVRLKISIDFGGAVQAGVRRLSPQRQLAVIAISFTVFFGIVAYSARSLWRSAGSGEGP